MKFFIIIPRIVYLIFNEKLKKTNKESLIIFTDKDVIPFHDVEKLHMHIPSAKLVLIKNCGHFP